MAAKGTAAKSASGASMSKYDMEVEKRLQVLEAQAHPDRNTEIGVEVDTDRLSVLEARFDDLLAHLKNHFGDLED